MIDAAHVVLQLEEAGATLLALRSRVGPAQSSCAWPETVRDAVEAYGYSAATMRPPVPSPASITHMDAAFAWLQLIPRDRYVLRRVVGARALVNPLTGRHVASWRALARQVGCDHKAIQRWHRDGVACIVRALNPDAKISLAQTPQTKPQLFPR